MVQGSTVSCAIAVPDSAAPGADLILALEGLQSAGDVGDVNSADALQTALLANGRTVSLIAVENFDEFECLTTFTDAAETIWVMTGTFPDNYRLTAQKVICSAASPQLG